MKLREKMYFDCTLNTHQQAKKNEKIADNYAIDFAEWLEKLRDSVDKHTYDLYLRNKTKKLLKDFKKEKKL